MDQKLTSNVPDNVLIVMSIGKKLISATRLPGCTDPLLNEMGFQKLIEQCAGKAVDFGNFGSGSSMVGQM